MSVQKDTNMSLLEFESVIVSAYQKGDNSTSADGAARSGGNGGQRQEQDHAAANGAAGEPDLGDAAAFPGMA